MARMSKGLRGLKRGCPERISLPGHRCLWHILGSGIPRRVASPAEPDSVSPGRDDSWRWAAWRQSASMERFAGGSRRRQLYQQTGYSSALVCRAGRVTLQDGRSMRITTRWRIGRVGVGHVCVRPRWERSWRHLTLSVPHDLARGGAVRCSARRPRGALPWAEPRSRLPPCLSAGSTG